MAQNFASLSPKDAIEYLCLLLSNEHTSRHRPLLHGDPGVGKSTILRRVAERLDAVLIDLRLMQIEAPDLRGLTMIDPETGTTRHIRPEFLPEYTDSLNAKKIIIFLDEIMGCHDQIRKSAFEMILDHRVGPHRFGDNVYLVAAGNSAEDGTIVYELDAATADRFCHIKIEPTVEGFIEHARESGYHPDIIALIQRNPGFMMPSKEDFANDNLVRPSPRSLERSSEVLHANFPKQFRDVSLKGWLGLTVGNSLVTELDDEASRFDLMALINAKPDERKYPTTPFGTFSLANNLASYSEDPEKLDQAVDIMMALPDSTNAVIEECKAAFFLAIEDKLRRFRLIAKYARDDRVAPFLARTDEILDAADQAHAMQQAA